MQILVVDDDPFAGEMIKLTLEALDYDVLLVEHALAAIEQLQAEQPIELIISDMNMPMISGIELFQTLRGQGIVTPFILLTGDDPEPLQQQEPALNACMLKDFSLDETLPEVIEQVMRAHKGRA
ncbi:MAG: response regulator [Gammaproteobacteria bacterium]|nr:response regulator [Gammaproteobacteria bacterium]OYY25278.1 MAG: response regulator [Thiotrichales bacterium 35-46-9]OYZ08870.1 MAG: response regulator [Thiotrichales bacterium 16-46-22]OZA40958.1 MAG: response regulator [Alphaproteobacteria bacterium 17-39-52]OZA95665.1 MAG: response regulator [Thiotrichales bacterium 34-46-19]UCG19122.1 MAG: response regulator [Thiotrichales bacterium]